MTGREGGADDHRERSSYQVAEASHAALPQGRIPTVGVREIVAALHRRRARRRVAVDELGGALRRLHDSVELHLRRISEVRAAVEAQGGDLAPLQHYDNMMARLRAELRSAERALAVVFSAAARGES